MNELLILLGALVIHECAHFIHYFACGFKPKFGWLGIGPCVEPQVKNIPVKYVLLNMFFAITTGGAFIALFHASNIVLFAYIVGCFMDMNNMQMLLIYLWRKTITMNTSIDNIKVIITK